MKLILSITLLISFPLFAGEGGSAGGPRIHKIEKLIPNFNTVLGIGTGTDAINKKLKPIQVDDVLLDTLTLPTEAVSALTIGDIEYREVKYTKQSNDLGNGLGFLIDLSEVQSLDTDKGIINLDDFSFKEGSKLLINENSGISDVFTKKGDLIIFNK